MQERIQKILDIPIPDTPKKLKSFLGLCNYYRSFIPNYTKFTGYMYKLLKKSVDFIWGEEQ